MRTVEIQQRREEYLRPSPSYELLRGRDALETVKPLWLTLGDDLDLPVFQRYEWISAWIDALAPTVEPWVILAGDPPAAILPMALRRRGGLRVLSLAGHGVSDYLGPIASSAELGGTLMDALEREIRHVDLVDLNGLDTSCAPMTAFVEAASRPRIQRRYEICPTIDTSTDWETYLKARRKKFRANLKRAERRTQAYGDITIDSRVASESMIDEMVAVEQASWKWEDGFAFLRDKNRSEFARRILANPQIEQTLWTCHVGSDLAAFAWVFRSARAWHYYLPSFKMQYSDVGTFLLSEIVQACFASPSVEFDFLQGDEGYKRPWNTHTREVQQLAMAGRGWAGRPALSGVRLRWWLAESERIKDARRKVLTGLNFLK